MEPCVWLADVGGASPVMINRAQIGIVAALLPDYRYYARERRAIEVTRSVYDTHRRRTRLRIRTDLHLYVI